jgi:hypothetical protein
MRVTVVFQRGKPGASVSNDQTRSGLAWMVHSTEHVIRKAVRLFWARGAVVVWLVVRVVIEVPRSEDDRGRQKVAGGARSRPAKNGEIVI